MAEANITQGTPNLNQTPIHDQTLLNSAYDPLSIVREQSKQIHDLQNMVHSLLSQQMIMNPATRKSGPKKEHFDLIPTFDGSPERLHYFLEITQRLHDQFYNEQYPEAFENFTLISGIKSKIIPPAANHVLSSSIDTYDQIKTALLNAYCDKRDDLTLVIELVNLRQTDGENAFKFHDKILKTSNLIVAFLQNHSVDNAPILIENYQKLALRCFLLHLKEPLGSLLRTRQPKDLATALSWLTNDYQHMQGRNPNNNQRNFQQKSPGNNTFQAKTQFNKTYSPGNNTSFRPPQTSGNFNGNVSGKPQNPGSNFIPRNMPLNNTKTPTQNAHLTNQSFAPRATSTVKPTPMSWRTSNTNFHNIENTAEPDQMSNAENEIICEEEMPAEENPQYEEEYFLEETSLENPTTT